MHIVEKAVRKWGKVKLGLALEIKNFCKGFITYFSIRYWRDGLKHQRTATEARKTTVLQPVEKKPTFIEI